MKPYQERYLPGSSFKVITTTAGLDTGTVTPETVYPPTSEYLPPGTTDPIENYGGTVCGGDLSRCSGAAATPPSPRWASTSGAEGMVRTAEAYGFNHTPPIDMPRPAQSSFPSVEDFRFDIPKLAQVSFGQNDNQITPLNMALVSAAVANRGVIMVPHVLGEVRDRDGNVVAELPAPPLADGHDNRPPLAFLNQAMIEVVNNGTARCCMQLANGVQAAAKTGTAQLTPRSAPLARLDHGVRAGRRAHGWPSRSS